MQVWLTSVDVSESSLKVSGSEYNNASLEVETGLGVWHPHAQQSDLIKRSTIASERAEWCFQLQQDLTFQSVKMRMIGVG